MVISNFFLSSAFKGISTAARLTYVKLEAVKTAGLDVNAAQKGSLSLVAGLLRNARTKLSDSTAGTDHCVVTLAWLAWNPPAADTRRVTFNTGSEQVLKK